MAPNHPTQRGRSDGPSLQPPAGDFHHFLASLVNVTNRPGLLKRLCGRGAHLQPRFRSYGPLGRPAAVANCAAYMRRAVAVWGCMLRDGPPVAAAAGRRRRLARPC